MFIDRRRQSGPRPQRDLSIGLDDFTVGLGGALTTTDTERLTTADEASLGSSVSCLSRPSRLALETDGPGGFCSALPIILMKANHILGFIVQPL